MRWRGWLTTCTRRAHERGFRPHRCRLLPRPAGANLRRIRGVRADQPFRVAQLEQASRPSARGWRRIAPDARQRLREGRCQCQSRLGHLSAAGLGPGCGCGGIRRAIRRVRYFARGAPLQSVRSGGSHEPALPVHQPRVVRRRLRSDSDVCLRGGHSRVPRCFAGSLRFVSAGCLSGIQGVVRPLLLPAAPAGATRCRRDFLR